MSENTEKAYRLRLPEDLYDDLEAWAKEEHRSVNGQIVATLQRAVVQWKARQAVENTEEDIQTPELVAA